MDFPAIAAETVLPPVVWRADTGLIHPADRSAADVIRFEQARRGRLRELAPSFVAELEAYPAASLLWVCFTREEAARFGDPLEFRVEEPACVIGRDRRGGFLLFFFADPPLTGDEGDMAERTRDEPRAPPKSRPFRARAPPPLAEAPAAGGDALAAAAFLQHPERTNAMTPPRNYEALAETHLQVALDAEAAKSEPQMAEPPPPPPAANENDEEQNKRRSGGGAISDLSAAASELTHAIRPDVAPGPGGDTIQTVVYNPTPQERDPSPEAVTGGYVLFEHKLEGGQIAETNPYLFDDRASAIETARNFAPSQEAALRDGDTAFAELHPVSKGFAENFEAMREAGRLNDSDGLYSVAIPTTGPLVAAIEGEAGAQRFEQVNPDDALLADFRGETQTGGAARGFAADLAALEDSRDVSSFAPAEREIVTREADAHTKEQEAALPASRDEDADPDAALLADFKAAAKEADKAGKTPEQEQGAESEEPSRPAFTGRGD